MIFDILKAVKETLGSARGIITFVISAFLIFALLILIPVWSIPGNDVFFQLEILETSVLALMIFLALANGLLITMQSYIRRVVKETRLRGHVTKSATAISLIVSSLSSTIACAACYSAVFAFLGLGTALFLVQYRAWFAAAAIIISLVALHFSSKRINHHCEVCSVKPKKKI